MGADVQIVPSGPTPPPTPAPPTPATPPAPPALATPAPSPLPSPVTPAPTAEHESEPEPEAEAEPETPSPGVTCVATPGLNRGVSNADCTRCAKGYQWWPCNEDILCQCSGSLLTQLDEKMRPVKRAGVANRAGAFLAADNAMLQMSREL